MESNATKTTSLKAMTQDYQTDQNENKGVATATQQEFNAIPLLGFITMARGDDDTFAGFAKFSLYAT